MTTIIEGNTIQVNCGETDILMGFVVEGDEQTTSEMLMYHAQSCDCRPTFIQLGWRSTTYRPDNKERS